MTDLLLHPHTKNQLQAALKHPAHALGIVGAQGSGKGTIATEFAKQLLQTSTLDSQAYFKHMAPENGSITIEQARDIAGFTKLKTTGTTDIRRVIIVEQAETMTREAQNAILKVIEEPPIDTVLILTLTSRQSVLPTILSRLQTVTVLPPTQEDAMRYFTAQDFTTSAIQRAYGISNGCVGLMSALLEQDTAHPMTEHIEKAKKVLQADTFERLTMIDDIIKAKQTQDVLYGLQQTAQSALVISAQNNTGHKTVERWQNILRHTYEARELLQKNTQAKLVLTNLLIQL